jgi:hypothetical protein
VNPREAHRGVDHARDDAKQVPSHEASELTRNGRQEDLKDLQSNEDQGGIRAEGDDEVVYPLPIAKEVPPLKEAFMDLPVIIQEKTESQEHQTIGKKCFPVRSEVFRGDGFFVRQRHIFLRLCFALSCSDLYLTLQTKPNQAAASPLAPSYCL